MTILCPPVSRWSFLAAMLLMSFIPVVAPAQPPQPPQPPAPAAQSPEEAAHTDGDEPETPHAEPVANPAAVPSNDAERILNMRRLLQSDLKQKAKLEAELVTLQTDFDEIAAEFDRIDERLTAARAQLAETTDEAARATLVETVARREAARVRIRDRFDLIIDRRKAVQQQLDTLNEKLTLEQEYLQKLSATGPVARPGVPAPATGRTPPGGHADVAPGMPSIPGLPSMTQPARRPDAVPSGDDPAVPDEDLKKGRKDLQAKRAALQDAQERAARLEHAIDVFERDLVNSRELLGLAEKAVERDSQSVVNMETRLAERRAANEDEEALTRFAARLEEVRQRLSAGRIEVQDQSDRVAKSEVTLQRLRRSHEEAVQSVRQRESDVRAAERVVWFLSSPMAPDHLSRWFTNKGPRVVGVVLIAFVLYWAVRRIGGRLLGQVVQRSSRGDAPERESRAETLRRVFDSTASILIIVLGSLTALNQAGVNVTVLLGGAAVIGAAIAFGSQNLIKDYFSGVMILMENQYSVGNVIKVGAVTGTVENITLRMTSIRDLEGVLHFMPHSQVLSVSNLTYGWSRIVMDIRVAGAEDPDRAMAAILEVTRELKRDPEFGPQILGEPEMLGVDQIGGTAMVIKVLVKTKPLNRWPVKRELLRRIKKRFDAAGIKIA
jgi:small-conductance mechanosensitive channel/predicted  nucleic acid-binding Zn-ribbon protein